MKILSLNTWVGRAGQDKLLAFLKVQAETVDVFCLQEVWSAPYEQHEGADVGGRKLDHSRIMTRGLQEITAALTEHVAYFRPHYGDNYGLLMLVRKGLGVKAEGELFVHEYKGYIPEGDIGRHARNIQYVTLATELGDLTVINFHGLWNGQGKTDSEPRLEQSRKILAFIHSLTTAVVLCGDFNLLPDTRSLKLLEQAGLRNLVTETGVTSTRTSLYTKPEKFADYIFTSPGLQIKAFGVLPDEVSDHSPLYLELE